MREATDLGISAGVRRELSGRRIDLSKLKFPVKAGVVTLQGELCFVGIEKTTDETAVELKFIESSLKKLPGVSDIIFELANWSRTDTGAWESASAAPASTGSAPLLDGEGIVCPECDNVIRFCPCCGKPLAGARSSGSRPRRSPVPVKPIVRKKRPLTPLSYPGDGPSPLNKPAITSTENLKIVPAARPTVQPASPAKPEQPVIATPLPAGPAEPSATVKPVVTPRTPPVAPPPPVKSALPVKPAAPPIPPRPVAPAAPAAPAMPAKPAMPQIKPAEPKAATPPAPVKPLSAHPELPTRPAAPVSEDTSAPDSFSESPTVPDFGDFSLPADEPNPAPGNEPDLDSLFGSMKPKGQVGSVPARKAPQSPASVPDFNFDDLLSGSEADSALPENGAATETPAFDLGALDNLEPGSADSGDTASDNFGSSAAPAADIPEEETPLPPMRSARPAADLPPAAPTGFEDDDTPLPPMRPKTPAAKDSKDLFASLFSETELNLGLPGENASQSKDPFGNLDLELDVLEVFPGNEPSEPAPTQGKKPPAPAKPAPADDNPFNLDNIIDLDSPVEEKSPSKKKGTKDPFDLDDFDISKFKL